MSIFVKSRAQCQSLKNKDLTLHQRSVKNAEIAQMFFRVDNTLGVKDLTKDKSFFALLKSRDGVE